MHEHFWPWVDYAELIKLQSRGITYRLKKKMPIVVKMNSYQRAKQQKISAQNTVRSLKIGKK